MNLNGNIEEDNCDFNFEFDDNFFFLFVLIVFERYLFECFWWVNIKLVGLMKSIKVNKIL